MDQIIHQGGHANVGGGCAAAHRGDDAIQNALAQALEDLVPGELALFKELLHEGFIAFRSGFGQLLI